MSNTNQYTSIGKFCTQENLTLLGSRGTNSKYSVAIYDNELQQYAIIKFIYKDNMYIPTQYIPINSRKNLDHIINHKDKS